MKTRAWLVATVLFTLGPFYGISQCGTVRTITYDTTIIGSGSNYGVPFVFTFPLFDTPSGTLTNVNLSSRLILDYDYTVENSESSSKIFRSKVSRYDEITSSFLSEALSYDHTFPNSSFPQNSTNYFSHPLTGTDHMPGTGNDFADTSISLLNDIEIINQNVPTGSFSGVGSVQFEYYTALMPGNFSGLTNTSFQPAGTDQITFSITYTYCDNVILHQEERGRLIRSIDSGRIKHKVYPNPSTNGNYTVLFQTIRSDWQIETFTSLGQLISRKRYNNTLRADVEDNRLSKGTYFIRCTNLKSHESFTERLLVK